jgi:vancomycin resistance protein YoaR
MKKVVFFIIVLVCILGIVGVCYTSFNSNNQSSNTNIQRLNANVQIDNTYTNTAVGEAIKTTTEIDVASFTTKLNGADSPRSHNIGITTSTLNETIVKQGETFSFCDTIGNPTADKGYEKANSFNSSGETVKTLGGGNCQVSSTLYNAVLQVADFEVVERHPHIKEVHYVQKDKDAAVSYGSVDFKFKNNMNNDIKIYANSDLNSVNIRIVKIEEQ